MKKIVSIAVAGCFLLSCMNNLGGTSDETVIRAGAVIYEPDGTTPAAGATVRAFLSGATDGRYVLRQTTEPNGRYVVTGLPDGSYNVLAQKDSLVSFQGSVRVVDSRAALKNDTLRCPSTLNGIVGVQPQDDPMTVSGRVVGTDKRLTVTDRTGRFAIKGLAAGDYLLLLTTTIPGYSPTLIGISVNSCSNDTLADTARVIYGEVPANAGNPVANDIPGNKIGD